MAGRRERHHRPVIFTRSELRSIGLTVVVMAAAAFTHYAKAGGSIAPFVISGIALALLASLVGRSVEALGDRLGAGATGVVQSALGNLDPGPGPPQAIAPQGTWTTAAP